MLRPSTSNAWVRKLAICPISIRSWVAAALYSAESQSRFVVVTSDAEMTAILNAPLAQWRVFLHPVQRKLAVGDRSGPVRILGGAGTGKTVLALHRAKWLAKNRTPDGQKVLFTTFTRNLALDVEQNLRSLFLDDPDLAKVEVCGIQREVDLTLVGTVDDQGQPRLGQWVLVHVGFAMSIINEAEARDTLEALQNMFEVEPDVGALLYGEER